MDPQQINQIAVSIDDVRDSLMLTRVQSRALTQALAKVIRGQALTELQRDVLKRALQMVANHNPTNDADIAKKILLDF